jgi:hypothetical protein
VALLFLEDPLIPVNPIVKERELAEALALLDVIRVHPLAVSGLVLLRGTLAGAPVVVLATAQPTALARLGTLGVTRVVPGDLPLAMSSLGGIARLTGLQARTPEN